MENVAGQRDTVERWPAQLCQPLDERCGRIERRAGKRTEAGDEDPQGLAHQRIPAICSAASAGEMRPPATSVSIRFTLARTEASERSRAIMSCSSIAHI